MHYFKGEDLRVLTNGDVLVNQEYIGDNYFIGNSSEISTWSKIQEKFSPVSEVSLVSIVEKVWDKVPVPPLFGVVFSKTYKGLNGIYSIKEPFESTEIEVSSDRVYINLPNPFILCDSDKERIQQAIDEYETRTKAKFEARRVKLNKANKEALIRLQDYVKDNPCMKLENKYGGNELPTYSLVLKVEGGQDFNLKASEFAQKVWPELWD